MGRPVYRSVLNESGVILKRTQLGVETDASIWIDGELVWQDSMRPYQSISEAQIKANKAAEGFASIFDIVEVVSGKRDFADGGEEWLDSFMGVMFYNLPPLPSSLGTLQPVPPNARDMIET